MLFWKFGDICVCLDIHGQKNDVNLVFAGNSVVIIRHPEQLMLSTCGRDMRFLQFPQFNDFRSRICGIDRISGHFVHIISTSVSIIGIDWSIWQDEQSSAIKVLICGMLVSFNKFIQIRYSSRGYSGIVSRLMLYEQLSVLSNGSIGRLVILDPVR